MLISRLDHLVLTVTDIDESVRFYRQVLGMEAITFAGQRVALRFGDQKINLHLAGHEYAPRARRPTIGSADLCLITPLPLDDALAQVSKAGVAIVDGPVRRSGACAPLLSFYCRDPSGNLIEIANELPADA